MNSDQSKCELCKEVFTIDFTVPDYDRGRCSRHRKVSDTARFEAGGFYILRLANEERQREWDTDGQLRGGTAMARLYRSNEFAGEAGEVCNTIKKLVREQLGIQGSRDTKEHLADEVGDAIICLSLICLDEDIDIWQAVKRKFNKTSDERGLKTRL